MTTIFNARGGNWTTPATWKGSKPPEETDNVILDFFNQSRPHETYIVVVDRNRIVRAHDLSILDSNTLSLADAELEVDSVVIGRGGQLAGTSADVKLEILSNNGSVETSASTFFLLPRDNILDSQIVNSGILHAVDRGRLDVRISVDNSGTIHAEGLGWVGVSNAIHNTGSILADGDGSIEVRAVITNDGGTIEARDDGFIEVNTVTNRSGGSFIAGGDGIIRINHNATGGAGIIANKAAIEFVGDGSGESSTAIDFQGAGTLGFYKNSEQYTGSISGFNVGSKIVLRDVAFDSGNDFYDPRTHQLTVADDTKTVKLLLSGSYSASDFVFQENGPGGGTIISFTAARSEAIDTPDEQVHALYVGYFGRAGDPDGVDYWENQLAAQQNSPAALADISAAFAQQAEAKAVHSVFANPQDITEAQAAAFVATTYQNLFGRAPDAEGAAYWQHKLMASVYDPKALGTLVLDIVSGAQGLDAATIANRAQGAKLFEDQLGRRDLPFDAEARALANIVIDGVTSDSVTVDVAEVMALSFASEELSTRIVGIAATHSLGVAWIDTA